MKKSNGEEYKNAFFETKNIVDLILSQNFTNQIFHLFSTKLCPKLDA